MINREAVEMIGQNADVRMLMASNIELQTGSVRPPGRKRKDQDTRAESVGKMLSPTSAKAAVRVPGVVLKCPKERVDLMRKVPFV
jgi:hypothetical protein